MSAPHSPTKLGLMLFSFHRAAQRRSVEKGPRTGVGGRNDQGDLAWLDRCPLALLEGPGAQVQFSSVQSPSHVQLFVTPWTAAGQASLSIASSQSLLKLMSIESVMPSNHLIPCRPLLLPPSVFPSIRVFSRVILCIRYTVFA